MAHIQPAPGPVIKGAYLAVVNDIVNTVAQNVFLAVFNPTTSGIIMNAIQLASGSYATGSSSTPDSFLVSRITAVSGGTQQTPSAVSRYITTMPDPKSQVFTGNPTVTFSNNPVFAHQPVISTGAGNGGQSIINSASSALVLPGQGLAFYTSAGNTNSFFNVVYAWTEF